MNNAAKNVEAPTVTVEELVEVAGPARTWSGNCHALATAAVKILRERDVDCHVARGHYRGYVAPGTLFAGRPFTQHSWVYVRDVGFVDPTRWVFTGEDPYVWTGPRNSSDYDEGGNRIRLAMNPQPPFPEFESSGPVMIDKGLLASKPYCWVEETLLAPADDNFLGAWVPGEFWPNQLRWLANYPPMRMGDGGEHARAVYECLQKLGYGAAIPTDNQEWAEFEFRFELGD